MTTSTIRLIGTTCAWVSLGIGFPLNAYQIWLILNHTPKSMRAYSKILLQTCITDLVLLVVNVLIGSIFFDTDNGTALWSNGILAINGVFWGWFVTFLWIYLIYISLFGFVVQFIYRYLIFNRSMNISPTIYFTIFVLVLLLPLIYVLIMAYGYFPRDDHILLHDQQVADILGLNLTEGILLNGYAPNSSTLMTCNFYYDILICTLAYVVIVVLGWRMHRFVRKNLRGASNTQRRTLEIQRQLTRTLIIQAAIPLAIYLPLVFNLVTIVFSMNLSGMTLGLQYYTMLSPIGMYFPATVDPLISILLIGHYRKAALWNFKFRLKITWKKANDVALNTPVNVSTLHQVDTRQNMRPIQGAYQAVVPPNKMETQINAHNGRR